MAQHDRCLYCNSCVNEILINKKADCPVCGMPLPNQSSFSKKTSRQKWFKLGFILLGLFCGLMIYWLPR